jgi:hypothetical protein
MLAFIKMMPLLILLGASAYGGHKFIVGDLEQQIVIQQRQMDQLTQQNAALQTAAEMNEQTIRSMEARAKQQAEQMNTLQVTSAKWEKQARDAQKIFADHNFTKLARLKPEMVEKRANAATADVFRSVESDSREIDKLDDTEQDNNNVKTDSNSSQ